MFGMLSGVYTIFNKKTAIFFAYFLQFRGIFLKFALKCCRMAPV